MYKTLTASASVVVLALAVLLPATAAQADTSDPGNSSEEVSVAKQAELDALRAIAGTPVEYSSESAERTSQSMTTSAGAQLDPFVCTLYPSEVHLRKSGGYGTAGAKPYTTCTAGTPSRITHRSTLFMVEWAGLSYVNLKEGPTQTGANTRSMTLTSFAWACKNSNNSKFMQTTDGTSIQQGTTYYSSVSTPVTDNLACGK
jgi:hypothetical protein